ncbi:zinc/manganese transport system substrate-binding protein [Chthoniobacter flavus]|nr:zinc ABC transporter substrate-binding protein [Chthoniobacter flavus]TCO94539.1 zinc/manganese transport system substrate-binding protein [Chthoniobacter flavus]
MKISLLSFIAFFAAAMAVQAADKIRVSTFSTILTEIAQQVGGDRVAVTGHVKPGIDPHEFEPKPEDLKIVGDAQLILLSAKHMESYVGKLKEATGTKGDLVEVGDGFASLKMKSEKDPDKVVEDPHWWQSVLYTEKAVKIVRDELIKVSPADKATFTENAAKYLAKLDALEKWVKVELAKLPRDKRKLVTSHDAFQYFARENGFTIHAIEGVSSEDQPSSKKVGDIVAAIKSEGVKAIFPENIENPKVMTEITRETGVKIAPPLYADGLGDTPEASTYEAMYKHNVVTIVEALK